ncbi:hypothetical protein [Devosia sp.]|uniref:hypothetical protein n=1 Tax=Devosia sp. TaxID=1871048 RepID=UPI00292CB902|nr:hypothetical protein [Devosia sp.]
MLARASFFVALALAGPSLGEEIVCEGAFAIDSSEARLIELYGADNVVTGIVPGPEGSEMLATTVFPDNPKKTLQFVWWDEAGLSSPSYIDLPPKMTAPGGVRIGMSLAEIEIINGEPFTLLGFGWDYGGAAGFESGALSNLPGDCLLSLDFDYGTSPPGVDTLPAMGDKELSSDDPLLAQMQVKVNSMSVGYPHPDFRD